MMCAICLLFTSCARCVYIIDDAYCCILASILLLHYLYIIRLLVRTYDFYIISICVAASATYFTDRICCLLPYTNIFFFVEILAAEKFV